ncbi:hypothetical protein O6H91_11G044100 [Diphasiastrum complanatum]|uniref:Uncharacterized protein n=4 Tax=Diphasiastrum complanatum TaxID=34168 RepID=A0ACC2C8L0_DIPCM|nr:hypothetical protein O6H91_11G044100 [Diphasiastrum complanatum]KAJ7538341.1 hypothetical protein O6H91_11G044100 [Diphasiastrum complanatum]KAJ7538342.1 hypothetical protein O6H91_11G044100 [Diphasiastrum complanatum]KAJ7538345.1 hypothetical protein O6H91_11G044100 [Diphasiastrum complanatum]
MSRLSFRPRPLDIHKKLPIVKSVRDLDNDESAGVSRTVQHNHVALDSENELVLATQTRRGSEIPTPQFVVVDSYEKDYAQTFVQPPSYLRGRGARAEGSEYVEYDLDDEDEDWLLQLNDERRLLSPERFEWMLFMIEILDHKARERAGGMPLTSGVPVPVVLQCESAIEALRSQPIRPAILTAVFEYWKAKRERWQKSILRRLQPSPPVNDTNPFNVFRPREKVHRPHTRRMQRRENDVQSFEKLRQVRRNLEQAKSLVLAVRKREEKKREVIECEMHLQRLHMNYKMAEEDGMTFTNTTGLSPLPQKFPISKWDEIPTSLSRPGYPSDQSNGHMNLPSSFQFFSSVADGGTTIDRMDQQLRRKRKRRRLPPPRGRPSKRIAAIESLEPVMLFVKPLDSGKLADFGIVPPLETTAPYQFHGRFGRGGRIVFDRWNPLTRTPIGAASPFSFP